MPRFDEHFRPGAYRSNSGPLMEKTTPTQPRPTTDMPLFYREPQPLEPTRHAKAGLVEMRSLRFAADTNSIPLAADEFYTAQGHYPIVFTATKPASPVVVVGLANEKNLFIDGDGAWKTGAYIPAYVRRYPFVFIRSADQQQFILAIDEAAEAYSSSGGKTPLFDGTEPAQSTKNALQFCVEFQRQHDMAQAFAAAAEEQGLLVDYRADVRRGGQVMTLSGFRVIDEAKFNALADEVFLDWRKRGFVALAYAQLMSMRRWEALAALTEAPRG
jgi:hypothetical protein